MRRAPSLRDPLGAALTHEELEAELRMALAEGLITRDEVEPLREEALRLG